jgi:eukaryotic-like serine/threonine-protein kinase
MNATTIRLPAFESALLGVTLEAGWRIETYRDEVTSGLVRVPTLTFEARDGNGRKGLVKVLDLRLSDDAPDELKDLEVRLKTFNYQRELIERLAQERLPGLVRGLHHGMLPFTGAPLGRVYYLIFEWSNDDLRSQVELHERFDAAYALRVLHQATFPLHGLHFRQIAHQSVRPANVVFLEGQVKLGEFSCAIDASKPRPDGPPAVDWAAAPPEVLYKAPLESMNSRFLIDLYQLGSLVVYLFSGTPLSTQLAQHLHPIHHWKRWTGSFQEALPYVQHAFGEVLAELEPQLPAPCRGALLTAVRDLCAPDPRDRGHPHNRAGAGPQYSVERYISLFDRLATRLERGLPSGLR